MLLRRQVAHRCSRIPSSARMFALSAQRPEQTKTLAHQKDLPRLPVPKLQDSLAKYLKSLKPLISEQARLDGKSPEWVSAELNKRQEWIRDFSSRPDSLGRILQERLVDVDRSSPNNWLNDNYWLKIAYHSWRVPLPINSNWWILCAHDNDVPKSVIDSRPSPGEFTDWQVRRAAVLTWRLLDFKERLDRQELLPDSSRAGPFDMMQYTRVFGMTRIPSLPSDHLANAPHPHPGKHIVVIVRDAIYILDVRDGNGQPKSKEALESDLWLLIKDVQLSESEKPVPVGVLTGGNRDDWSKTREHLIGLSPTNRGTLSAIEDALFVLALDDWTRIHPSAHATSVSSELIPQEKSELQAFQPDPSLDLDSHILNSCAGRDGHNRWFDKCLTVSVESNTRATVNGEHSPCDALIPSIVADYMLAESLGKPRGPPKEDRIKNDTRLINAANKEIVRLSWVTDERIEADIKKAEGEVKNLVQDSEGLMLWFDEYGAEWIKKQGKQSPDAYIQMAMQLAYRRLHGHGTPTYETASTRLFLHARTDVIRTYSEDSQHWVEAVIEGQKGPQDLYTLLTAAVQSHNAFTREASMGKGFDRHLLGLRLNLRDGEAHPLLQDPLFSESQSWKLSTSGLSAGDRFFGTGFGATDPDGYGINYLAGQHIIKFGMESKRSSKVSSTDKFRLELIKAMRDMRRMCEDGQRQSNGDKARL